MSFLPSRMASGHDDRVAGTSVGAAPAAGEESVGTGKVLNEFCCDICGLTAPFEVFSTSPPTRGVTRKIRYREKCYSSMDTFRPPSDRLPMVVGAPCSECEREMVCLECSLFFSRRFCVKCVRKNKSEFPKELNKDISKLETNYAEVKRIKKAAEIERCSKS